MEFRILFAAVSLLFTFLEVTAENDGDCNELYQRYSASHTGCQKMNKQCHIKKHGVTDQATKDKIIEVHNELRSIIANQKEGNRGLPPAADMMQLEWDDELSYVAQKRGDECIYAHDKGDARRVQRFSVGQNIGKIGPSPNKLTPDWERIIRSFYSEIKDFKKREICGDREYNFEEIGHFTALVWAKTFKVGCGYTQYKDETGYYELYYCNYGPGGNVKDECVYDKGPACSKCPENTECNEELGLCKRINEKATPIYPSEEKYFFNCNFRNPSGDCGAQHKGDGKWGRYRGLQFDYAEIVLEPGQNSTMIFAKKLTPPKNSGEKQFCVALRYRKGPTLAKNQPYNDAIFFASPKVPNVNPPQLLDFELPGNQQSFQYMHIQLAWTYTTQIKISFAVPEESSSEQFFNVAFVRAYDGKCNDKKDIMAN